MSRISSCKYIIRINKCKDILKNTNESIENTCENSEITCEITSKISYKNLHTLIDHLDYFKKNKFDLRIRQKELYETEIEPTINIINDIIKYKMDALNMEIISPGSSIKNNLTFAIKKYPRWRIDDLAIHDDYILEEYVKLLKELAESDKSDNRLKAKKCCGC